ncbi:MAG: Hint domain-containing homing endonuclease [Patescibacteria group bacterium]
MKDLISKFSQTLKTVFLALVLSFGVSIIFAWTGPTQAPPNGNTSEPINISSVTQVKSGGFGVGNFLADIALFSGPVGIATTTPSVALEVVGEVKADNLRTTGQLCIDDECYASWGAVFAAYANLVVNFTATPSIISPNQSSTLNWSSNSASCLASGDWSGTKAASGSENTGLLTASKSYTLECVNLAGSSTPQIATVTVSAPTINSFTATPSSIAYNSASTLDWSSTDTTGCTASGAWSGAKAVSGSQSTGNLTSNQTYTLTCTGPGGTTAPSNVTVTVGPPPASISSFYTDPISYGVPNTLYWSSSNATYCTASGSWSGTKATGGSEGYTPNYSETYGLTCTGPGGTSPLSTVYTGDPPPNTKCFIAGTKVLLADGAVKLIEEVKIGDMLLGKDNSENEVLGFLHHPKPKSPIYGFNGEKPFATEDHPFMTLDGWKSVNPNLTKMSSPDLDVGELEVGDVLISENGLVVIDSIEIGELENNSMVYNFIMGGNHTYYANGYLVSDYFNHKD